MTASCVVTMGCSAGTTRHFDSGVARDRPFDQLTATESTTFCEASERYVLELYSDELTIRTSCLSTAVPMGSSVDVATCEAALAACVASAAPLPPVDFACADASPARYPNCTATIAEIEGCADATYDVVRRMIWPLDCRYSYELLTEPDPAFAYQQAQRDLEAGPCAAVAGECPVFYAALGIAATQIASFVP